VVPVDGIARWVAPLRVTKKPDGGLRTVVELRGLSAGIDVEVFPFPTVDVALGALDGLRFVSSVDLHSAVWQVP
jgi:hypothetical protein